MNYKATVTMENQQWLASVDGLPGAHTFARTIESLRRGLREVVVLAADLPDDAQPAIELVFDVKDAGVMRAFGLGAERRRLATQERFLAAETTDTVRELQASGYGVRDIADLVGLTPGRVSQLVPQRR